MNEPITGVMLDFCAGCGAFLAGGDTQHQPACPMLEIIRQHFGDEAAKQVEKTNRSEAIAFVYQKSGHTFYVNVRTKHDDSD